MNAGKAKSDSTDSNKWAWLALALILAVTFAVYYPAMSGAFIWDDDTFVTKPELRSLHGLWRIWFEPRATLQYYPLLYSAFWLEHRLWGDAPFGYHLVNLFLHLLIVTTIYAVLRKLEIPGALLAAGIFALHPVHAETVAWISEQKNTLSGVFYISALLAYLHFDARARTQTRKPWLLYSLALGLFLLSILSKSVTATLPAALLLIFWWKRGHLNGRQDVLPLVPFFVFGISVGLFTAYAEHNWVGAAGGIYDLSVVQRVMVAPRIVLFYLGKLLLPVHLAFSYPHWDINPWDWTQWLYPFVALAILVSLWALRHRSRAPLAAFLFFVGTLFPVLGFFNVFPFVYSYVADHFQYLASLGIIVLTASGITIALNRLFGENVFQKSIYGPNGKS
jgi:hypothetical protein